jgi:hypothetical protein
MSGRVPSANHATAPTYFLYGRIAISSVSSLEVGRLSVERWVPSGVTTEAASVRLKRAKIELMSASCEIEIVRAERSRSSSIL